MLLTVFLLHIGHARFPHVARAGRVLCFAPLSQFFLFLPLRQCFAFGFGAFGFLPFANGLLDLAVRFLFGGPAAFGFLLFGPALSLLRFLAHPVRAELFHGANEPVNVGLETIMRETHGVSANELRQTCRQAFRARHFSAIDQHRDNVLLLLKRGLDFDANPVRRIVDAPSAFVIFYLDPTAPNHREENIALGHARREFLDKVSARCNAVDIKKDVLAPESALEQIIQSPRRRLRFLATIVDENVFAHRNRVASEN